jgi:hypothetical protein
VIVGRTISCLLYAWRLQRQCILLEPFLFHPLSEDFDDIDFTEFNVSSSEELKDNLLFIMGITNLLKHGGNVASLREDGVIITKGNRRISLKDSPQNFDGKNTGFNAVFDNFHWRSGQQHEKTLVKTGDNFCNRIVFYSSTRHGVNSLTKDFTTVSYLSDKELLNSDYGQGMARIKTARILKFEGLRGDFAWQRGEKKYYKSIKFDFAGREVVPRVEQKMTFKEVYGMKQVKGEPWKTWKRLTLKEKTWLG